MIVEKPGGPEVLVPAELPDPGALLEKLASGELAAPRAPEAPKAESQAELLAIPASFAELVERLLGESGLDPAVSERVVKAADGNPLFVEQMVSMLIDKKLLRREAGTGSARATLRSSRSHRRSRRCSCPASTT